MSDCIKKLCVDAGHYPPRTADIAPRARDAMELGTCLEWGIAYRLSLKYPNRYIHFAGMPDGQGEFVKDDIYLSPDLLDLEDECVEDVKLTWKSSFDRSHNKPVDADSAIAEPWWWQVMSYCHVLGVVKGRIRVVFVNGDYSFKSEESLGKVWEKQWSKAQLMTNWATLKSVAAVIKRERQASNER